jgi:hypothetical protein
VVHALEAPRTRQRSLPHSQYPDYRSSRTVR